MEAHLKYDKRLRRIHGNLCATCGKDGHAVRNCPTTHRGQAANLSGTVLLKGCQSNGSAAPVIRLNTTSITLNAFLLSLTSATVAGNTRPFIALLDLGSSHCFI